MKNYYKLYLTNGNESYGDIYLREADGSKVFESFPVIGELVNGEMYELLTGKLIRETDAYSTKPCLTYFAKEPVPASIIINLYKRMTYRNYSLYLNALNRIEKYNIEQVKEFMHAEEELKKFRSLKLDGEYYE